MFEDTGTQYELRKQQLSLVGCEILLHIYFYIKN